MDDSMKLKPEGLKITGIVRCTLEDVNTGKKEVKEYKNLITNAGKVAIARRLAGTALYANESQVTYGATGTDNTTVAVGDTTLGTELARKVIASTSYDAGTRTCTIRVFFTTAESNGALKEYGLFGEAATAAADSGTLMEHANIDLTKDNTKTLTVEVIITVS